jgi:hypothetical protein
VKENGVAMCACLNFQEWHIKEEGYLLPMVWLSITGIWKPLREYLNLGAGNHIWLNPDGRHGDNMEE